MTNTQAIVMVLGNLVFFGAIYYAVFFLGHSGWWFVLPVCVHFSFSDFRGADKVE